jgi:hypothetical protein
MAMNENGRLWSSFLGSGLTWSAHLGVCYFLHATMCERGNAQWLWIVTAAGLVLCAAAAVAAWTIWQGMPPPPHVTIDEEQPGRGRARFLAMMAFAGSCFFALVIIGQTVPFVILKPCD